jgi:Family of unknown function (DUF6042)
MDTDYAFDGDFIQSGWLRWLPHSALMLHIAVVTAAVNNLDGDIGYEAEGNPLQELLDVTGGLDAPVWLSEEDEEHERPDDLEQRELLVRSKDRLRRAAAAADMPEVVTNRDLLELMRRLGLVSRLEEEGGIRWRPVSPLPLPDERIHMLPEEESEEDAIRWRALHASNSYRVIAKFKDEELTTLQTSIADLAADLGLDTESTRYAVEVLLQNGDFTATADPARVTAEEQFSITVDWERFAESRIAIRFAADRANEDDT